MEKEQPKPTMKETINFIIKKVKDFENEKYLFRGTNEVFSKKKDGISSSLYRYLIKEEIPASTPNFIEKEILERAERLFPDKTSNIEILTELRHYGGNVNLIDFSYSFYIALFFARNGNSDEDGEIIILKEKDTELIRKIDYNKNENEKLKRIEPRTTPNSQLRVAFQSSIFVRPYRGYIPLDNCDEIIKIPSTHKENIRKYLENIHNITLKTIYNDVIGFIQNEKNYETATIHFHRGIAKAELGDYEEAIQDYNEAIKMNPSYYQAYNNRGVAKYELGLREEDKLEKLNKYKEAIQDYDKAIKINPNIHVAYNNRGNAKAELGQHEEAIQNYDKAIKINPKYALAYYNRGNSKNQLDKYEAAIQDFDKALELIKINPNSYQHYNNSYQDYNNFQVYNNRGIAKFSLGKYKKDKLEKLNKYKEAIQDYDEAIKINPKHAPAYHNRGNAKAELGLHEEDKLEKLNKYKEAIQDYDKTIEINLYYEPAYYGRGNAKFSLGQYKEAIQDYDEALKINPDYAPAYYNRGLAKDKLGLYEEAKEDFKKANELDSNIKIPEGYRDE